jgi:hypothetical protein
MVVFADAWTALDTSASRIAAVWLSANASPTRSPAPGKGFGRISRAKVACRWRGASTCQRWRARRNKDQPENARRLANGVGDDGTLCQFESKRCARRFPWDLMRRRTIGRHSPYASTTLSRAIAWKWRANPASGPESPRQRWLRERSAAACKTLSAYLGTPRRRPNPGSELGQCQCRAR